MTAVALLALACVVYAALRIHRHLAARRDQRDARQRVYDAAVEAYEARKLRERNERGRSRRGTDA